MKNKIPKWEKWLIVGALITSVSLAAGFIMAVLDKHPASLALIGVGVGVGAGMIVYAISWCGD